MIPLDKDRFKELTGMIRNHNFWWRDERKSSAYEAGRADESYILRLCKDTQEVSKDYSIDKLFKACMPHHWNTQYVEINKKNVLFFVNHITKKF